MPKDSIVRVYVSRIAMGAGSSSFVYSMAERLAKNRSLSQITAARSRQSSGLLTPLLLFLLSMQYSVLLIMGIEGKMLA